MSVIDWLRLRFLSTPFDASPCTRSQTGLESVTSPRPVVQPGAERRRLAVQAGRRKAKSKKAKTRPSDLKSFIDSPSVWVEYEIYGTPQIREL